MSVAPKQWTVKVISPPTGRLVVLRDGKPLPLEIGPDRTTPVEVLLVSIGTCFALSCHAAFAARGKERVGFEVSVTGRKALQPPSRLTSIELEVTFDALAAGRSAGARRRGGGALHGHEHPGVGATVRGRRQCCGALLRVSANYPRVSEPCSTRYPSSRAVRENQSLRRSRRTERFCGCGDRL
jgi:hypothetical protein